MREVSFIEEKIRNQRKIAENLKGYTYKITNISAANCHREANMVPKNTRVLIIWQSLIFFDNQHYRQGSVWRQAVNEDATDLVNVKPVIHVQDLCGDARDCSRVKNEMCSDQESTPTSQILVRPESSQKNEQGKSSTSSLHLGNSDVSVTSIDAAFRQLATTLFEGFNLLKPEMLTFN